MAGISALSRPRRRSHYRRRLFHYFLHQDSRSDIMDSILRRGARSGRAPPDLHGLRRFARVVAREAGAA